MANRLITAATIIALLTPLAACGNIVGGGLALEPEHQAENIAQTVNANLVVNGDFEYPKWSQYDSGKGGPFALPWVYLNPQEKQVHSYWQSMNGQKGQPVPGLDETTFPWVDLDHSGQFEIHREKNGNLYADVHKDRTVGQKLQTVPGAAYQISIRHSGRSASHIGGTLTLLAGADKDHLAPIELSRTTLSATGAKEGQVLGPAGIAVVSPDYGVDGTSDYSGWDHTDGWETYVGSYIVPAGQSSTIFAYRGGVSDSCIDDLSFKVAYPLSYDMNGGTGGPKQSQ